MYLIRYYKKSAIMAHKSKDWCRLFPLILLGLRNIFKEDIKATPAELVFGQYLRLSGEFLRDFNLQQYNLNLQKI